MTNYYSIKTKRIHISVLICLGVKKMYILVLALQIAHCAGYTSLYTALCI